MKIDITKENIEKFDKNINNFLELELKEEKDVIRFVEKYPQYLSKLKEVIIERYKDKKLGKLLKQFGFKIFSHYGLPLTLQSILISDYRYLKEKIKDKNFSDFLKDFYKKFFWNSIYQVILSSDKEVNIEEWVSDNLDLSQDIKKVLIKKMIEMRKLK